MIILTTAFNCENFIEKSLSSILNQSYKDFRCFITDDLSTDETVQRAKKIVAGDSRFKIIENKQKFYQPGNYDQILRNYSDIDDDEVIIEVDGDDWLPDEDVFYRINNVYRNKNIWIANGSFMYHTGMVGFSKKQRNFDSLRLERFTASHIRTWRAFLWRKINQDDLKDENGKYWKISGDLSFMLPMLEMSGPEHYTFMPEINYVYNESNPLNDHKVDIQAVFEVADKIRKKPKYSKI